MYPQTMKKINDLMAQGVFPGYSLAFIDGERTVKIIEGQLTSNPDSPKVQDGLYYDMASVTKAFVTSTLLVGMVDRGEIDLDRPIKDWFDQVQDDRVTLRHLVTHTSGLWGYIPNRNSLSAPALIDALARLPISDTYNTVKYTDTGFVLAGIILERTFGKTVADLFEERLAKPLGLKAQYGPLNPELCVPTAYDQERGGLLQGVVHDPKASILGRSCGSAGLFATLDDCLSLVRLYLNKGHYKGFTYCSPARMDSLLSDWTPTRSAGRSLGWDLDHCEGQVWLRHTGFTGTTVLINIKTQQALVLLTNRINCFADTPTYNALREELIGIYERKAGQQLADQAVSETSPSLS